MQHVYIIINVIHDQWGSQGDGATGPVGQMRDQNMFWTPLFQRRNSRCVDILMYNGLVPLPLWSFLAPPFENGWIRQLRSSPL